MAELAFSNLGGTIGSRLLPSGGGAIGQTLGALAGSYIDSLLFPPEIQGTRIEELQLTEAREGAPVHNAYGRARVGGQVIWAARFSEYLREPDSHSGGKGGPTLLEYAYTVSFAVGICSGPIQGVSRIWANGAPFDLSQATYRIYYGDEQQNPDPLIEAIEGSGQVPAFRGLAYIVFEDLPLDDLGTRIPQLSFEVLRGMGSALEQNLRAINMMPGTGEFAYATSIIQRQEEPGVEIPENMNNHEGIADFELALDQLAAELPEVSHIHLLIGWFGNDLRMSLCDIRPGIETRSKNTRPRQWSVAGENRSTAWLISHDADEPPVYGGTPDDTSVREAIALVKARGYTVTLYPILLMDIAPGNGLPDPYAGTEQAAWPERGQITARMAPGLPGSPDGTELTISETRHFFGTADADDFEVRNNGSIRYSGPDEWRYRRFILHYAALGAATGIDGFLIGSGMRGLTRLRDYNRNFPVVSALVALAAQARQLLGDNTRISYAADWTEYASYTPPGHSDDVHFPLDELWADSNIDYIGLNWFAPMADWREGTTHLDLLAGAAGPHDLSYLEANIEGAEAYDWVYASKADRENQNRTPISDDAYNEPWIYRRKDLRSWWNNAHYERRNGIRQTQATDWVPQAKPVRFVEFGCPAIDKGVNEPHVFPDPGRGRDEYPFGSDRTRDDLVQRRCLEAFLAHWQNDSSGMIDTLAARAWDARPWPSFPALSEIWSDSDVWASGYGLNGRVGLPLLPEIIDAVCAQAGLSVDSSGLDGLVPGYSWNGPQTARRVLEPLQIRFGFDVIERDGALRFALRNGQTTPLDRDRLVASEAAQNAIAVTRADMETRHGSVRVNFIDSENAFRPALETIEGELDAPARDVSIPVVMDRSQARARASELQLEFEAASIRADFEISPAMAELEPGDQVQIDGQDWRITHLSEGAHRRAKAVRPAEASLVLAGAGTGVWSAVAVPARPDLVLLDAPALPGSEDNTRPLAFAFVMPWTGPIMLAAGPDRTSLTVRAIFNQSAIMGRTLSEVAPAYSGRWHGAGFEVAMQNGSLSSLPDLSVLAGANAALLETRHGWELLQYQSAGLIAAGRYRLDRLLRGQQGSERQAAAGADPGARIVFLSGPAVRVEIGLSEAGLPLVWRAASDNLSGENAASGSFTHQPVAQKPWSPVHLRASRSGDRVNLDWIRRARIGGDLWEAEEVPLEGVENYRVEIWSGDRLQQAMTVSDSSAELTLDDTSSAPLSAQIAQIGTDNRAGQYARIAIPL